MSKFTLRDAEPATAKFFLEQDGPVVRLCAEDSDENIWYVLSINRAGQVEKASSISQTLGLDLDKDGKIVVNEQEDF